MKIAIRPIAESDMELLHKWLNRPHLRPFYMREDITLEAVWKKYVRRIGRGTVVHCTIAELDKRPFGFAQWYANRDVPDYGAAVIGKTEGVSIDYYIGDPAFLGRSLGSKMLVALVEQTLPQLKRLDRVFFIGHDKANSRAIRCTKRAGFTAEKDFVEGGIDSTLFTRNETGVTTRPAPTWSTQPDPDWD